MQFADNNLQSTVSTRHAQEAKQTSWIEQLGRPGPVIYTSEALVRLPIRKLTNQFVHCHSFQVLIRPSFCQENECV